MSITYTAEKMYVAARSLAIVDGGLRQRLYDAWLACHTLNPDNAEDFPNEDLRDRFRVLMAEMSSRPALASEGTVHATLNQASDAELRRWATEMFEIAHEVAGIYARER